MLDRFYNYLATKIVCFFKKNELSPGAKYNVQFEKEEEVLELYRELSENQLCEIYEYKDDKGDVKYTSYLLNFKEVKLIVAATIEGIQPDFLTRLRNLVGVEPGYEDKAILFIHNTNLDSIIGGSQSFSKEGMPFDINSIENDIKGRLALSQFNEVDKAIIKFSLENKKDDLIDDNISIFEYRDVLEIINGTCIEKKDYKSFGIFYDSNLINLTGKQLTNSLKENSEYFSRVLNIHNYEDPETQLNKYFSEKGINKLKDENWREVDFKDIKKSIDEKRNTKLIEYKGSNQEWDKEEGSTQVKSRIRNIIVFNEDDKESVELEFLFDDYLKRDGIKCDGLIDINISGKKLKATIHKSENDNFYKVIYTSNKDGKNIKFEFKIVMLACKAECLNSIKAKYSIVIKKNYKYILVNTNDSNIIFNEYETESKMYKLKSNHQDIEFESNKKLIVSIDEGFQYEDEDLVRFNLKLERCIVPIGITGTNQKTPPIDGFKVWKFKRENNSNFELIGENKLLHGTKEYFTRDDFRVNINLEKEIIRQQGLYFIQSSEGLEKIDIDLNEQIKGAYEDILNYFKQINNIPSLSCLNEDLKNKYANFIKQYISEVSKIREESVLTKQQRNLFKLGTIKREYGDEELLLTPLHPINIAYQLHISDSIGNEVIDDNIFKKFSSTYLLPYITTDEDKLYIPIEQHFSPEWKYYVDQLLPRYRGSRNFVSKLVDEKIEEFTTHFKYMFTLGNNSPIKINLINTGDSKEIVQGIFKYYVKQLRENKLKNILPIEISVYSNDEITTTFEEVSFNEEVAYLKDKYDLDLKVNNMSEEDVLNLYREKVSFYIKKDRSRFNYAHITFLEMDNDSKIINSIANKITSGTVLDGMISGVPSVFMEDSYRTGFGIKHANVNSNLMKVVCGINSINASISGEPYRNNECRVLSISNKSKTVLDKIYESSHWVTFIDPKVDLNFFSNAPESKDLLIIHYSDQYTTAGGYDAITVTRKSGPYKKIIEDFLIEKGIKNVDQHSSKIINMFNAINGDWLLRLLSSKSYFPKEKISILSAVKLALAELKSDDIIWVPISLEEVLRVSGATGLKQSEGFLSAKNLGFDNNLSTSDDILMVGIENNDKGVMVHYYPIEVKIGENSSSYVKKGIEQAKETKRLLNKILLPDDNGDMDTKKILYRNFLMQLVVISTEKLKLYDVCNSENWIDIIDSDLRRKLLNEEYVISNNLKDIIGEAGVISFKKGIVFDNKKLEDNVMIIEMSEDDGINFITKDIEEIEKLRQGRKHLSLTKEITKIILEQEIEELDASDSIDNSNIELFFDSKDNNIFIKEDIINYKDKNMEILFGVNQSNAKEIYWYPNDTNKLLHTNTGIIGTMGTGKTQFTKSVITQLYRESKYNLDGKDVGILIFDYKGDYNESKNDFIDATNANVFKLHRLPFNPLAISKSKNSKPMLPLHIANTLKETLAKAFGLGIKQETLLRELIIEAYERRGIIKNDPSTWDNLAPTLKEVYDIYINREDLKEDSLYAAFSNLIDFEIFETDPSETKSLFDLIKGVTVIDLSGYDPGIQNLVVAITLDLFYSQMQAHGHSKIDDNLRQLNKIILVDEADNFLSKNFDSLKKILKEGREFGVGTILSTQLLSHFSTGENDYANYILTWVIHNVSDLNNKDVKYIFNTQHKSEEENIYNKIKSLTKHYSLVKMGNSDKAMYMRDKAFWELINK